MEHIKKIDDAIEAYVDEIRYIYREMISQVLKDGKASDLDLEAYLESEIYCDEFDNHFSYVLEDVFAAGIDSQVIDEVLQDSADEHLNFFNDFIKNQDAECE